ncbi:MAG: ORF6N domain-containing protein [Arcobacteraceae bacterium]
MNQITTIPKQSISDKIYTIRGVQVMLDRDLAELYGVETKHINQAVKRNKARFPNDFSFQLNDLEKNELVTKCDHLENLKYSTVNPYVFTEQGVSMLSAVLRSNIAIDVSVKIIRAFVQMRKFITSNPNMFIRFERIEQRLFLHDEQFNHLFKALENNSIPTQGIFYNGQIFDAYVFINDLLKEAKGKVLLIDNYIDDSIFTLFSKYPNINFTIYTQHISKQLELDYKTYQKQYTNIELKINKNFHDRFIIIDDKTLYHLGASLKDLGKKVFAFSKLDMDIEMFLDKGF